MNMFIYGDIYVENYLAHSVHLISPHRRMFTTVSKEEWVGSQGEASSLSHHTKSTVIKEASVLSCHMASDSSLPLCNQKAYIQILVLLPGSVIIHAIE